VTPSNSAGPVATWVRDGLLYHCRTMYSEDLRARLSRRLRQAPAPQPDPGDRLAAVLVPIVRGAEPSLVFTVRTERLSRHAGEISFPGGLHDIGDDDLVATALRESHEELGLNPARVDVLGALEPVHTTVSAILVVPVVGMFDPGPEFVPNEWEIAEVLELPIARLAPAEAAVEWQLAEGTYTGFAYEVDGYTIWGMTARILSEFLEIVREETPWLTSK
jgi:8-oxo-dGTP pyrophosphatase MutT (NUDIX family)